MAVAAAYAACYEVTRYFSYSHWILTAGLRLACLLLVPYRFWPALILGESLPVMQNALLHEADFGWAWTSVSAIPFIPLCMPFVKAIRSRMPLFDANGQINANTLLFATLVCAVVTALRTDLAVFAALIVAPDGWDAWRAEGLIDLLAYVLGAYLGALSLAPMLLAVREWFRESLSWKRFFGSTLTRDVAMGAVPLLIAFAVTASASSGIGVDVLRLAMAVPVIALTARHGWTGTAVGGMLSSIALATTSETLLDPAMIRVQVILALVISSSLIVGIKRSSAAVHSRVSQHP
ncbi:MAG TPA: MASE1 domain-containing protein [Luteibacter sp.]|uniref:MASE1 domain-containing protein n=1 Tax=Luteibacter sp. TaxID=1886636 RepID=UPI002B9E7FEB|nr:MASE1 domain-containing protein [Luteibacter sp.]HVI54251.1 MASE1 domain-containing protein [Luteibacter sp.]